MSTLLQTYLILASIGLVAVWPIFLGANVLFWLDARREHPNGTYAAECVDRVWNTLARWWWPLAWPVLPVHFAVWLRAELRRDAEEERRRAADFERQYDRMLRSLRGDR